MSYKLTLLMLCSLFCSSSLVLADGNSVVKLDCSYQRTLTTNGSLTSNHNAITMSDDIHTWDAKNLIFDGHKIGSSWGDGMGGIYRLDINDARIQITETGGTQTSTMTLNRASGRYSANTLIKPADINITEGGADEGQCVPLKQQF